MQYIEQVRTRLHNSFLRKELPFNPISRHSVSLDQAASIGILFDGTDPEDRETVLRYADKLKEEGKKVKLLAFFNNNLKSQNFAFHFFNRRQVDFYLRPKNRDAMEFAEQSFDLLLNLSSRNILPLDFIAAHSKARFRVGPHTENTFCYDLMIEHSERKGLSAYLQEVISYLKTMQPDYEAAVI
jgi:hypothetical protein